jgi:F-type H+-transporting ATPase subunit delta
MASPKRMRRTARQFLRFCIVDGSLNDDRVRQVVERVIRSRRRGVLGVLKQFQRLVRLDRERHSARIESAAALPEPMRAEVTAGVVRIYGTGIETSFAENPALIGGVRVQVGSDVYDGSVRAKLDAIEAGL